MLSLECRLLGGHRLARLMRSSSVSVESDESLDRSRRNSLELLRCRAPFLFSVPLERCECSTVPPTRSFPLEHEALTTARFTDFLSVEERFLREDGSVPPGLWL